MYPCIFGNMSTDNRKNIKISPQVHKELKVYCAQAEESMDNVAELAIMEYIKSKGHKPSPAPKQKK